VEDFAHQIHVHVNRQQHLAVMEHKGKSCPVYVLLQKVVVNVYSNGLPKAVSPPEVVFVTITKIQILVIGNLQAVSVPQLPVVVQRSAI
jgi:hypothetical protein